MEYKLLPGQAGVSWSRFQINLYHLILISCSPQDKIGIPCFSCILHHFYFFWQCTAPPPQIKEVCCSTALAVSVFQRTGASYTCSFLCSMHSCNSSIFNSIYLSYTVSFFWGEGSHFFVDAQVHHPLTPHRSLENHADHSRHADMLSLKRKEG